MLKINLENNVLTIESPTRDKVRVLQRPDIGATGDENIRITTYFGGTKIEQYTTHYSDIEINGETFTNIDDALAKLSTIVSVFKPAAPGGGGVSPSDVVNAIISHDMRNSAHSALFDEKLDKVTDVTTYPQAYVKNANGTQAMIPYTMENIGNSIVQRNGVGTFKVSGISGDYDAVNKMYVDSFHKIITKTVTSDNITNVFGTSIEYTNPLTSLMINVVKSNVASMIWFKSSSTFTLTISGAGAEIATNGITNFDPAMSYEITILMGKVSIVEFKPVV